MRKILLGTTLIVGIAASPLVAPTTAHAERYYKWCAVLSMGDAAYNCGFDTIEQCRATLSGFTGFCEINSFYNEPVRNPAKTPRTRRPN